MNLYLPEFSFLITLLTSGISDIRHPIDNAMAASPPAGHRHAEEGGSREVLERGRLAGGTARPEGGRHLR